MVISRRMSSLPDLWAGHWRLRALKPEDAEAWLALVLDPELRRLTSWNINTLHEMRRNIVAYIEGPRAQTTRRWAIVNRDDELCGTCGFKDWDQEHQAAELSYELAPQHRGRGAMSTIAKVVITHGVEEMRLRVIRALVMVDNTASIRLLEKLGLRRIETLTAFRKCDGILRDFYSYERLLH